jgi:hypothetical protein
VRHRLAQPLATAFGHAYWWALVGTAIALVPAIVLALAEQASRRESAAAAQRASRAPSPIPG